MPHTRLNLSKGFAAGSSHSVIVSGILFIICGVLSSDCARVIAESMFCNTYRIKHGELCGDVTCASNSDESFVKALEFRMFELSVIEAKEIIHNNVTSESWEGMTEVKGLFSSFKFLHAKRECVHMTVDDVDEVQNGAPREPVLSQLTIDFWWDYKPGLVGCKQLDKSKTNRRVEEILTWG